MKTSARLYESDIYYLEALEAGPKRIHSCMLPKRGRENEPERVTALFLLRFIKKLLYFVDDMGPGFIDLALVPIVSERR